MVINILANGDFSQGAAAWSWAGYHPVPGDAHGGLPPLANLKLSAGSAEFIGWFDRTPVRGGTVQYLAPPSPHLSRGVYLEAGHYSLSFDAAFTTSGMNVSQKFELLVDGAQAWSEALWVEKSPGTWGAATGGARTVEIDIAAAGVHTLSFGFNQPGFNLDTSPYGQWANRVRLDGVALGTATPKACGTEADDRLAGTAGADLLWSLAGQDLLEGRGGADTLCGGSGADVLTGGAGRDRFVFSSAPNAAEVDLITDFVHRTDKIVLDAKVFTALGPGSAEGVALAPGQFRAAAEARDADDHLLYDRASGTLSYDADGAGGAAAVPLARLGTLAHPVLGAADVLIVA